MNRTTVLVVIGIVVVLLIGWFALTSPDPDPVAGTEQPLAPDAGAEPATGAADAEPPAADQPETDPVTGDEAAATTPADTPDAETAPGAAPAN